MLREIRRLDAPELAARHLAVEVRSPMLRIGAHRAVNVASDFGVVNRALPFVHRMSRPCLTVLLEGRGRFDEGSRRLATGPGDVALSDQRAGGTEAYAGERSLCISMEWDPSAIGASFSGGVTIARLSSADRARIAAAAAALEGPRPAEACIAIVDVLRSTGLPFARVAASDLGPSPSADEQALATAIASQLSNLRAHPTIDELGDSLGWSQRLVHRRFTSSAQRHSLPWQHWRSLLHHVRLVSALRLLAAPGATTEMVARLTGLRAPSALCHAFAKCGLPSPGTLARIARGDVLDAWAQLVPTSAERAA